MIKQVIFVMISHINFCGALHSLSYIETKLLFHICYILHTYIINYKNNCSALLIDKINGAEFLLFSKKLFSDTYNPYHINKAIITIVKVKTN